MNRTIRPEVRDMLHEIPDTKFVGESDGSAPIFGAGEAVGTFNMGDW